MVYNMISLLSLFLVEAFNNLQVYVKDELLP